MKIGHNVKKVGLLCAILVPPAMGYITIAPAIAASKARVPSQVLEVWPGKRVLLLLPLTLGPGWNVDTNFGQALLPDAEASLQRRLEDTGKFSVIEPHRFNPILQRALQERRISKEQLDNLVTKPTLENARVVMAKLDPSFDQAPLIGQFTLEEVRVGGTAKDTHVQVQATGRLYEIGSAVATQSSVVTSNSVSGGGRTSAKVVGAATDAFSVIAAQFVKPIEEIGLLPEPTAPATPSTPPATPETPTEPVDTQTPTTSPPATPMAPVDGGTPTADASTRGKDVVPQLPAPEPPLGINVPNAATVGR